MSVSVWYVMCDVWCGVWCVQTAAVLLSSRTDGDWGTGHRR